MSENYAVINGKRVELTDKQVKMLEIKRKNPFKRVSNYEYYFIKDIGDVCKYTDNQGLVDNLIYDNVNYFNDEDFAKQVALHQLLYRKLLKFAYDNNCEDTEWNAQSVHWYIYYKTADNKFDIDANNEFKQQGVYFSTSLCAERAIKDVVEPFMKEHPDFVW